MEQSHKILILDDDPAVLDLYKEWLSQLPSKPEIHTANSGARAIALLDAEPFRLLICDLKMPKMDGLQVLSIVRRRFPELRTVVITGVQDEEFRSRAYALGVDLFWLKPDTQQNMQMFLECLEALLGREQDAGFRGVQSKSLMDILQMESLSQTSGVLRITRGSLVGKIWLFNGELIDAETDGARGEAAFTRILGWKSGTFETLPPEPNRERTITKSVNGLLLEAAQTIDEIANPSEDPASIEDAAHRKTVWRLASLAREGADWVVSLAQDGEGQPEGWGTEVTAELGGWIRHATDTTRRFSELFDTGPLMHIQATSQDRKVVMLPQEEKTFLVAWPSSGNAETSPVDHTKKLVASWDS
jgi:CheY-like chemotaxis protein